MTTRRSKSKGDPKGGGRSRKAAASAIPAGDAADPEGWVGKRVKRSATGDAKSNAVGRKVYRQKGKVYVREPMIVLLDELMTEYGVSDAKLGWYIGVPGETVRDWRRHETLWRRLLLLRKALWVMGYRVTVTRMGPPAMDVVDTTFKMKKRRKARKAEGFQAKDMWKNIPDA